MLKLKLQDIIALHDLLAFLHLSLNIIFLRVVFVSILVKAVFIFVFSTFHWNPGKWSRCKVKIVNFFEIKRCLVWSWIIEILIKKKKRCYPNLAFWIVDAEFHELCYPDKTSLNIVPSVSAFLCGRHYKTTKMEEQWWLRPFVTFFGYLLEMSSWICCKRSINYFFARWTHHKFPLGSTISFSFTRKAIINACMEVMVWEHWFR